MLITFGPRKRKRQQRKLVGWLLMKCTSHKIAAQIKCLICISQFSQKQRKIRKSIVTTEVSEKQSGEGDK